MPNGIPDTLNPAQAEAVQAALAAFSAQLNLAASSLTLDWLAAGTGNEWFVVGVSREMPDGAVDVDLPFAIVRPGLVLFEAIPVGPSFDDARTLYVSEAAR